MWCLIPLQLEPGHLSGVGESLHVSQVEGCRYIHLLPPGYISLKTDHKVEQELNPRWAALCQAAVPALLLLLHVHMIHFHLFS